MRVEVDQSGKVEKLNTSTVVSFSDGDSGSVFITAGDKREVIKFLKKAPSSDFGPLFFCALISLLLRNKKIDRLLIDEEYTGKEKYIESSLRKLFKGTGTRVAVILFGRIEKLSPAHRLCWQVHRDKGRAKNVTKIKSGEVFRLLRQ